MHWFIDEAVLHQAMSSLPLALLLLIIVVSVMVLSKGADWMVDGVVHLAQRTRLPRIVIGATIVSLGTTAPEAFVSVMAAYMGNAGLALGNGVGSIIADTGLIFGITCMLATVRINRYILNRIGWVQVGVATLLVIIAVVLRFSTDGVPMLPRTFGIFFLFLLACYMYLSYRWALNKDSTLEGETEEDEGPQKRIIVCWLLLLGGLVLVILSARVLIPAASEIAFRLGVPEDVIAATMVALGTSLPELITAVSAVRKGHPDIVVGNVVGADVLNCLFVIGASATARPLAIPDNFFYFHFPAMLIILYSMRLFIAMNRQGRFYRWQGGTLLGMYLVYIIVQYTVSAL